jgi:hypothetical protein
MRMKFVLVVMLLFITAAQANPPPVVGPSGLESFGIDLSIAIIVEVIASYIYLASKKLPKKILLSVVVANIISVPLFLFAVDAALPSSEYIECFFMIIPLEIAVIFLEAAIIQRMNKKEIKWNDAVNMSFYNNVASYIVGVIIITLFFMQPSPFLQYKCEFPAGFSCLTRKLQAVPAQLYLEIGQGTGHTIRVNGIACMQNTSQEPTPNKVISYGLGNNLTMVSGTTAILASPYDTTKSWLNISCTDSIGQPISNPAIGEIYKFVIYINYTELDTNISKVITGSINAKFEPN